MRFSVLVLGGLLGAFLTVSCATTSGDDGEALLALYQDLVDELPEEVSGAILEPMRYPETGKDWVFIHAIWRYGVDIDPFTGRLFFRDHIAYPYYSVRTFKAALSGVIVALGPVACEAPGWIGENCITIRTGNLEIDYFGSMDVAPGLAPKQAIARDTMLGTMTGGGDVGMQLKIRMRYKGVVIDPSFWFAYQLVPVRVAADD